MTTTRSRDGSRLIIHHSCEVHHLDLVISPGFALRRGAVILRVNDGIFENSALPFPEKA